MDQKIVSRADILILCGGKGTRIAHIAPHSPKILLDINGRPFIDILLDKLINQGFNRAILSVGHMADKIVEYVNMHKNKYVDKLEIVFSHEDVPLGTGGAVYKARDLIRSDPFMVMNGDVIFDLDFNKFYNFHLEKKAFMSLAVAEEQKEKDYGIVSVDGNSKILGFKEKKEGAGLVSAGTYVINKTVFDYMGNLPFSLEYDFFPRVIQKECYGYFTKGRFIDIGTPERYQEARDFYESYYRE